MPDRDSDFLSERGRSLEEDYFRKKDQELIEKMRQAAVAEQARTDLRRETGLDDPALLDQLRDLGFTPETVRLLPLVPLLEVAWAEGGVTPAERELILRLATARGIEDGSAASQQLTTWLGERPREAVFAGARRLVRAMLESAPGGTSDLSADNLVQYCEQIASASGGMLGIRRISSEERALLSSIAADLKVRQ
jgi:hypothetical protein